ncbi:MAG: FG-GAP-like repeat-containing protein [Candidatus Krumholzibacteria bacterium]|nr:FG-GAP-like repeat-containing protein [Candidatus Krumholzibacteria bacterium]MDH4336017.1 FG-GAP-like repeat-containing protein [Candidatus Krumholzibacteria bacterium]MDH5268407.1 FG-GAP-like repeat-containing protein [Candidatus Krumholzibacteria bacterium]
MDTRVGPARRAAIQLLSLQRDGWFDHGSRRALAAAVGLCVLLSAAAVQAQFGGFTAVPPQTSGLDFQINGLGNEDWGYGAAFFDLDGDGDLDLFVANEGGVGDWLFRQNADRTFTDIGQAAGCADTGNNRAVKFADYDNDGDEDVFVAAHRGPNRLFRNNGDGTFTDVADPVMASGNLTFGAAWGDYNRDGYLDLYVVNRIEENQFFVNDGDGTFTERAAELGLADRKAGLEAVWIDYDNDGDVDLYLSNDKHGGNRLWRNNDDGTFTDVSVESGSNISIDSMGIGVGDFDGNGFVDLYLTNTTGLTSIKNVLLRARGDGTFENVATALGVQVAQYGWGNSFLDYDNDMDLDLYVVNWDFVPGASSAKNQLFRNNGDGSFTNVTDAAGVGDTGPGYGLALGDYNNDGFVDMFVSNNRAQSVLYRAVPTNASWLKVKTQGTQSNRDGIGARVTVVAGGVTQFRDVSGGESYLCQPSLEVEFGLGGFTTATRVDVRWPSGVLDRYENVAGRQTLLVVEGETNALIVSLIEATVEDDGVRVRWDASREAGVLGFRVYRRTGGGAEKLVSGESLLPVTTREFVDAGVPRGNAYQYVVAGVEDSGEARSEPVEVVVPVAQYTLMQNAPNPFNPRTEIWFDLPGATSARLAIYDAAGALVRVLVNGDLPAGRHRAVWTGRDDQGQDSASGIYFYRLESAYGVQTRKMVLLK